MTDITAPTEIVTFDLEHVVKTTGAPSEDWLRRKIRKGDLTARRAGRHWRMTESDMAAVVEYMKRPARLAPAADTPAAPRRTGLTARASRNLARSA